MATLPIRKLLTLALPATLVALTTGVLAPAPPAYAVATDAYVSPTGSDLNPCTQAAPCATFAKGVLVASADGTLHIAPGDYRPAAIVVPTDKSGLTITGDGAAPADVKVGALFLGSESTETFTVRNLRIENLGGTLINDKAQHLLVEDVEMAATGGGTGQLVNATRKAFSNFENVTLRRVTATTDRSIAAIQLDGALVVEDSTITNTAPGLTSIVGVGPGSPTVTVRRSTLNQVSSTTPNSDVIIVSANSNGVGDVSIDSSFLVGGRAAVGVAASGDSGSTVNVDITNSTLLSTSASVVIDRSTVQAPGMAMVANSSVLSPRPSASGMAGSATATCAYSAVGSDASVGTPLGCAQGGTNPAYSQATFWGPGGCCSPSAGSAAIDAGDPAALGVNESTTDLNRGPRVAPSDGSCTGGRRDIGAVEYAGGLSITPTIAPPSGVKTGAAATFSATANKPGATFTWTFGDGSTATGSPVSHTYTTTGAKTVGVTATLGLCTGHATTSVSVAPGTGSSGSALTMTAKLAKPKVKHKRAATLNVTLSAPAKVTVTAKAKKKGSKPKTLVAGQDLAQGTTALKIKTKKLKPGKYTLTVTAGTVTVTVKLTVKR